MALSEHQYRQLQQGRTDFILCITAGQSLQQPELLSLACYYGDVSALRYLLQQGCPLFGAELDSRLREAAFHGHWQLTQFLLELGADVNSKDPDSDETALLAAVMLTDPLKASRIVTLLLASGAEPKATTRPGAATGMLMRDCRCQGETALHRAAAYASDDIIRQLLAAGAELTRLDIAGRSALSWASQARRPADVLRLLLYPPFQIHPNYRPMAENLLGMPLLPAR